MLIHSASQLLTIPGGPQRGTNLGALGIIPDGAVLVRDGLIADAGDSRELLSKYPEEELLDISGHVLMPGFVDPHTHLVWAGDRAAEFEMRLQGKTYLEIMEAGGGIQSTVQATRAASDDDLLAAARERTAQMLALGTTTAEAKSGYGLRAEEELRLMDVLMDIKHEGPLEIIPTFLGAHAVPEEFKDNPDDYVNIICSQMLPGLKKHWEDSWSGQPLPFVDVFCDKGAFDLDQACRILKTARSLGFPLKIHADEFKNLGGASLAAELGAVSADHLVVSSRRDIKKLSASGTAAVSLPCTPFGLGESEFTPAREIIENGGLFALASDLNPGTAWCGNMQFVIALACRYMRLTPAEAVAASTINAAAAVNMDEIVGSVEPRKQADLIILAVDDYRHLAYRFGTNLVQAVFKKGELCSGQLPD